MKQRLIALTADNSPSKSSEASFETAQAALPKADYDLETKKLAQFFKNVVKKEDSRSKPGYRDITVTASFPKGARMKKEIANLAEHPGSGGAISDHETEYSDG